MQRSAAGRGISTKVPGLFENCFNLYGAVAAVPLRLLRVSNARYRWGDAAERGVKSEVVEGELAHPFPLE